MSLWNKLLRSLGYRRVPAEPIQYDPRLQVRIRALAEEEQCPEEEVASALLVAGLARHQEELERARRWEMLTRRERQVAVLVCRQYLFKQIARELKVSVNTVRTHVRNISRKLGVEGRDAVREALQGAALKKGRRGNGRWR